MNVLLVVQPHTPIHLLLFFTVTAFGQSFFSLEACYTGLGIVKNCATLVPKQDASFPLETMLICHFVECKSKVLKCNSDHFFLSTKQPASFKEVKILHKKLDVQSCKHVQTSWKWAANKHWNGSENLVEWLWLVSVRCQCRSVIGHPEPL